MTYNEKSPLLSQLTLGKTTDYIDQYSPELLQGVPRSLNRDELSISLNNLPFKGEDIWYGYELSWLNAKGKPVVAVAEFRFCCTSENIVESKSFKLYLNSFNQTQFSSWQDVQQILEQDLSKTANGKVSVQLFPVDDCQNLLIASDQRTCIDELDIEVSQYQLNNSALQGIQTASENSASKETGVIVEEQLVSHLLKSNCLITHQPDWASVYIDYKGAQINHEQLLKYLISFRQHNEFHEQCVERIFCDLQKYGQFDQLTVFARYTRRGGLDINPFRSTKHNSGPSTGRTIRQ